MNSPAYANTVLKRLDVMSEMEMYECCCKAFSSDRGIEVANKRHDIKIAVYPVSFACAIRLLGIL